MTNLTLLDFLPQDDSPEGDREDKLKGMGGPQGAASPASPSMPRIKIPDRRKRDEMISKSTPSPKASKNEKINHADKNQSIPSTRWTDEEWRKYYWSITYESPSHLIERASKIDDDGIKILLDMIINGDPYDKRRKKDRNKDGKYRLDPMNWHLLCELVKAIRRLEK